MSRAALPQDYILNAGTLVDDFETIGDWSAPGSYNSIEANTEQFVEGTQSMKSIALTPGGEPYGEGLIRLRINYEPVEDFSVQGSGFHLWFYLHTAVATLKEYIITFSTEAGVSYYSRAVAGTLIVQGWNHIFFNKAIFTPTGAPSWSSILRIDISFEAENGEMLVVSVDDLRMSTERIPKVLITFDDG
ncbi:unnamed protein product, partial [marine sediment metagenome]